MNSLHGYANLQDLLYIYWKIEILIQKQQDFLYMYYVLSLSFLT